MKKKSGFSILMLLLLIVLAYCVKEDLPTISEESAAKTIDTEKSKDQKKDSTVIETHVLQKVFTTYIAIISGNEAISGLRIRDDIDEVFTVKGVCWSTFPNPTVEDFLAEDESSLSISHFHITGLELNTTYFLRTFVKSGSGISYGDLRSFTTPPTIDLVFLNPDLKYGSVKDIDGNIYKTIQIGKQTWMAENLKTTRYNNGSQIPNVTDDSKWLTVKIGAYRWYENEEATFKNLYGAMYNWYSVNTGELCPTGWHVPGDDEWKQMEMALGMTQAEANSWGSEEFPMIFGRGTDQGHQIKTADGWINWEGMYSGGTNTSGFSGLPGGDTGWYGKFEGAGGSCSWWSSTEFNFEAGTKEYFPIGRSVCSGDPGIIRGCYDKNIGFSVRCLKD